MRIDCGKKHGPEPRNLAHEVRVGPVPHGEFAYFLFRRPSAVPGSRPIGIRTGGAGSGSGRGGVFLSSDKTTSILLELSPSLDVVSGFFREIHGRCRLGGRARLDFFLVGQNQSLLFRTSTARPGFFGLDEEDRWRGFRNWPLAAFPFFVGHRGLIQKTWNTAIRITDTQYPGTTSQASVHTPRRRHFETFSIDSTLAFLDFSMPRSRLSK